MSTSKPTSAATLPLVTDQSVSNVIEHVLNGATLKEAASRCGMTPSLFNYRLQSDREAAIAYARAVEIRADLLADEALTIADNENDAAKARNQIQVRQWLASKLYARRYGDRIDLNVTQTLDVTSTLAEARARRLRPVRDQYDVTDAQVIDLSADSGVGPSDTESQSPGPDATPDIFS